MTFVRSTFDLSGPGTGIPALSPFSSEKKDGHLSPVYMSKTINIKSKNIFGIFCHLPEQFAIALSPRSKSKTNNFDHLYQTRTVRIQLERRMTGIFTLYL